MPEGLRLSIAIRGLLENMPANKPVSKHALLRELAPKFHGLWLEEFANGLARHCEAMGARSAANETDFSSRPGSDTGRMNLTSDGWYLRHFAFEAAASPRDKRLTARALGCTPGRLGDNPKPERRATISATGSEDER